ncbi:AsnC family transcriptional regulator [Natronorubrum sp. FCH18a]|uniref:AsnC family transcriptional regulator n=1 Tax=Natronorubrum sp. FCH18a TaxID=3447018 RepID=UPI003F5173E6
MRDLDETDLEILSMLTEDARRPFSEIGKKVGLTGPAVSDRVKRLQEAEIINRFTVDMNRGQLRAGIPVFVQFDNSKDVAEELRSRLSGASGIEHLFVTAEGKIWVYGRAEGQNVRNWIEGLLEDISADYSVTLVDDLEWAPSLEGTEFAITCAECGNTVDKEGESVRFDETVYHFCCGSCRGRFQERYQQLEQEA